jgi:hypothetical protein
LSNDELIAATRELAHQSCAIEAHLLAHVGETGERKPHLVTMA